MTLFKLEPQDFELISGNDKQLNFVHRDRNNQLVDLTGATIVWALSKHPKARRTLISYSTADQVQITDPVNGAYNVKILSVDTEPLKAGDYFHEVRITSASGLVHTAVRGTVEVKHNVIDT